MAGHIIDITFFGDIEFSVAVTTAPAEPDVGIMTGYIDEWIIEQVDESKDPAVIAFFNDKILADEKLHSQWVDELNEKKPDGDDFYE